MFARTRLAFGSRLLLTALVAAAAVAVTGGDASAQATRSADKDAPKDNKALAKEHFQRGTSFYDLGRYTEAIREFEAAYHLKNDPAFLYNLAQAYRLAGNPERALHFYRTYLRYVPKASNRAEIEERIEALEKAAAEKASTQTSPPPVGATPPPVSPPPTTTPPTTSPPPAGPVPPPGGPPTAAGAPPSGSTDGAPPVTTDPSGAAPPPVTSPAPFTPAATAATPTDDGSKLARRLVFGGRIAAGVGAGMFLIGVIQGLRASGASDDVEKAAENGDFFDPAVERRGQSAERAQWWWIGLGTLVGAAGGAAWYFGLRMQGNAERAASTAGRQSSSRLSFTPIAGPGRTGALLQVQF